MNPTSHSVESRQDCGNDLSFKFSNEEQLRLNSEFAPDYCLRSIPWRIVGERLLPERNHFGSVVLNKRSDPQFSFLNGFVPLFTILVRPGFGLGFLVQF